jgi:cell division protein FtsN
MIKSDRRHTLFAHNKHRKKESSSMDFDDFFKKATILPNKQKPTQLEELEQQQNTIEQQDNNESTREKEQLTTKETMVDKSEILKGVIACIDVR